MNSVKTNKKTDFTFSSVKKWLFQKIKVPWLSLFLLTFFSCYFNDLVRFNVRTNFNQKNPGYGVLNWFFIKQELNPTQNQHWYLQLLLVLLLSFLLGVLVLNIICHFLQDYSENLSENWLKKLVIYRCLKASPATVEIYQARINNIIFHSINSLSFYFVSIPVEIFKNLVKISFEVYFLSFFLSSKIEKGLKILALGFNLTVILFFICYILLTAELQKQKKLENLKRNQAERQKIKLALNRIAQQGSNNLVEGKEKQILMTKIFQLFDHNLKKNKSYFLQKNIFYLPSLIIPGLNVIFYFLYYRYSTPNFTDAFVVYFLSLSIQNIFWKLRNLFKQVRNYNKFRAHYNEFNFLIKTLN